VSDPEWLSSGEVEVIANSLAASFPAAAMLAGSVAAGQFRSHTSAFYELATSDSAEPVALLKVGGGWTPSEAKRIHDDMAVFDDVLAQAGAEMRLAPPLGWHDTPALVCMGRIAGEDLGRLLRASDAPGATTYVPVVRACGTALGLFHSRMTAEAEAAGASAIRADVAKMAAAVRVKPWFLDEVDLSGSTARRYGDFAPYNIRVDDAGRAWIIDQPSSPAAELVHRDVAWFLFNVERRLGWDVRTDKAGFDEARKALVTAFHDGYRVSGPVPLDTPADRSLLALYRAHRGLWTARRRFRQRELGEVPAYLRLAARWRAVAARRG
jgi:hypothetical protein